MMHLGLLLPADLAWLAGDFATRQIDVCVATGVVFPPLARSQGVRFPPCPHIGGVTVTAIALRVPVVRLSASTMPEVLYLPPQVIEDSGGFTGHRFTLTPQELHERRPCFGRPRR